jgi:hypothetical protein
MDLQSETENFKTENKIRAMISEVLGPFIRRFSDNEMIVRDVESQTKKLSTKVEAFNESLEKSLVRMVPLEAFNKKVIDLYSENKNLDILVNKKLELFNSRIIQTEYKMNNFNDFIKAFEEKINFCQTFMASGEKIIADFKENIKLEMINVENIINKISYESHSSLEKILNTTEKLLRKFPKISEKVLSHLQYFVNKTKESYKELEKKIQDFSKEKIQLKDLNELKRKLENDIFAANSKQNSEIKIMKNYIDKAIKFDIKYEINDKLLVVLELKQIKKFAETLKKDIKVAVRIIEESKDKSSENYQLPGLTLSQIIFQRQNYEKQLQLCNDKIKLLEKANQKSFYTHSIEKIEPIKKKTELVTEISDSKENFEEVNIKAEGDSKINEKHNQKNSKIKKSKEKKTETPEKHPIQYKIEINGDSKEMEAPKTRKNDKKAYKSYQTNKIKLQVLNSTEKIKESELLSRDIESRSSVENFSFAGTHSNDSIYSVNEKKILKNSSIKNSGLQQSFSEYSDENSDPVIPTSSSDLKSSKNLAIKVEEKKTIKIDKIEKVRRKNSKTKVKGEKGKKSKKSEIKSDDNPYTLLDQSKNIIHLNSQNTTQLSFVKTQKINEDDLDENKEQDSPNFYNPGRNTDEYKSLMEEKKNKENSLEYDEKIESNESSVQNDHTFVEDNIIIINNNPEDISMNNEDQDYSHASSVHISTNDDNQYQLSPSNNRNTKKKINDLNKTILKKNITKIREKESDQQYSAAVPEEIDKLEKLSSQLLQSLNNSANNIRQQILKDQEELQINIKLIHEENRQLYKQRLNDLNRIDLELKNLSKAVDNNNKDTKYLKEQTNSINNCIEGLLEVVKITYNLINQDEEDRDGIKLSVFTEHKPRPSTKSKLSISLKPECLSCTGQNSTIYSAFKIACLNYSPSDVPFNNKLYPRRELIKLLEDYIFHIKEFPEYRQSASIIKSATRNEQSFLRSRTKTPKISARYILNNSSGKINFDHETISVLRR